jgi:hypothetical protein
MTTKCWISTQDVWMTDVRLPQLIKLAELTKTKQHDA